MVKEVQLTQGMVALVDDEDYEKVCQYGWVASSDFNGGWRPKCYVNKGDKKTTMFMYRLIVDARPGEVVDHINHNALDNRRANLRKCTQAENAANQIPRVGGTSKYKGVCWAKDRGNWLAKITVGYKQINLGHFASEWEAATVYDKAALEYFGEFAYTNLDHHNK